MLNTNCEEAWKNVPEPKEDHVQKVAPNVAVRGKQAHGVKAISYLNRMAGTKACQPATLLTDQTVATRMTFGTSHSPACQYHTRQWTKYMHWGWRRCDTAILMSLKTRWKTWFIKSGSQVTGGELLINMDTEMETAPLCDLEQIKIDLTDHWY